MDLEALNYIPIPVVVLERSEQGLFNYCYINRAAVIFSGLAPDEILGRNPRQVFPGRAGNQLARRQERAARECRALSYTYPIALPRGEVWIETRLVPIQDADGQVSRLMATMQDRTNEKRLAEQKLHSEAQLKGMESEIERYISMAAHDLRTPMRHVTHIAEMLREDFVDHGDGKLELIDMLEEVGVKASKLITEVLSFARASSHAPSQKKIDLAHVAGDIFAVLDPKHAHDLSADPGTLETDSIALQITLRNLVDNAIKHSEDETVSVHISLVSTHDDMLTFRVRDDGRGFEDPSLAFLDGGEFKYESGFGLLGVKRLISARGGTINAERPEDGRGAKILFSLPGRICAPDEIVDDLESGVDGTAPFIAAAE